MKRKSDDTDTQSRPAGVTDAHITMSCTKKLRRYVSDDIRSPSKIRWKSVLLEEYCGRVSPSSDDETESLSSDEESEERRQGTAPPSVAENNTWYSKAEYKEMLLNQSLTVRIMRSLRSLVGEKVSIEYCDEIDSDIRRFDELIKKHQIDPEEYCERGLESYLSEERRNEINASRKLHKLLVIGEYIRQGMVGNRNPELIRNISMNQSKKSLERALKLAVVDQRERLAGTHNSSNTIRSQDTPHSHSRNEKKQQLIKKEMECVFTDTPPSPTLVCKTVLKSVDSNPLNLSANAIERCQPGSTHLLSEGVREEVMKQQLIQLFLTEQERIQNQRDHHVFQSINSISTPDKPSLQIANTSLASLEMQGLNRLVLHQFQQQQQRQLQIQHCYETQLQRQFLLQHQQQHIRAVQMASAAILGQHHSS